MKESLNPHGDSQTAAAVNWCYVARTKVTLTKAASSYQKVQCTCLPFVWLCLDLLS